MFVMVLLARTPSEQRCRSLYKAVMPCRPALSGACAIIDLTGVLFIDDEGKVMLDKLWRQGATLQAAGCLTKSVVEEVPGGR